MTPDSGFVFGRRYFSGLTYDGRGSTGARWVTSISERLVAHTLTDGRKALQHFSWVQPYNDPDHYYVETAVGSNVYSAPAFVGGTIVKTDAVYELTWKTGRKHTFTDGSYGIRLTQRKDSWGNSTSFDYVDPIGGYGGYSTGPLDEHGELVGGVIVVTDARGVSWTVAVNGLGYIQSITDPLGGVIDYYYAQSGGTSYLTKVRYPMRDVMEPNGAIVNRYVEREFTYNSNGRLHQVLDDYGVAVLTSTYDSSDPSKVATQTDGTGAVYTFSEPVASQTDVVSPKGWKRSYLHDSNNAVIELRQYVANFAGQPARSTNQSLFYTWLFERAHACNCGAVTKITEPDGGTIHITANTAMDLTEVSKRSPDGATLLKWKWTYDAQHRIATFVPPEGNAAADPAPHTVTITRQQSGSNLITTRTIPPRDWRTDASVWTEVSDNKGRMIECAATSHDGTMPSFEGKWTYHASGAGIQLPLAAYQLDATSVAYSYAWNSAGRLTGITDDGGHAWSCTYDPEGRPLSWTAPALPSGQVQAHEWLYDGNGRLRRLRWKYFPDSTATTGTWVEWFYVYDAMGQVLSCSNQLDNATTPAFATETWAYDLHGNCISATDADGQTTTATYDERDLPWVLTDGVGTTEQTAKSYEYNADGRLTVILERLDATRQVRFENEYDSLDRLSRYRIKDAANPATEAGYVESSYDSGSRVAEIKTWSISNGTPRLVDRKVMTYADYHTSPTRQVSYVYDLTTGAQLRAVQSDFDYGPTGRPLREYTENTLIAQYTYLPCGLPKTVSDAHGNEFELAWNQYGRALSETNTYQSPASSVLVTTRTWTYDLFGRSTTVTDSGVGVASQSHTYVYDSMDNVVQHTGPDGAVQTYQYRYDGATTREDSIIAGSTVRAHQVQYTAGGKRHIFTDDRNKQVQYIYDGRGRLKQEIYPDSTSWTNQSNDAGYVTKITAPSGRTVDIAYDWRGMLSSMVYKNGAGAVLRTDAFTIDVGGFIKRVTRTEAGVTHYVDMANDSTGRVLEETTDHPGIGNWSVNYQYDGRGRMIALVTPNGYEHLYGYDDRNRVDSVSLQHSSEGFFGAANYAYLGTGRSVVHRQYANGTALSVDRDGHGRITAMTTPGVSELAYGYDAGNRVNREFRALDGKGDAFWYDGLGRLTKTTRDSDDPVAELASGGTGSTPRAYRRQFAMDDDTHRSQVVTTPMTGSAVTTDYQTHADRHHYTQIQTVGEPAVSRAFDADGRLTSHGSRTFFYDASDNLIEVKDSGVMTGRYTFDALGRRVAKTTSSGMDNWYVHAGAWLVEDYRRFTGQTNWYVKGTYVHGPGIDSVVMMRHRDWCDQDSDINKIEPKNVFVHQNRLGSVTELTAEDGSVVERYRYDDYGKPTVLDANGTVLTTPVAGNNFLFTGREYDWETGLYHYRARAYDPATGTFLQEDPLGMADGVNVVAYVNANPVNLSDPFGTDGVGEMIDSIMNFINENRDLVAGLIMDLLGPLEGVLDLLSAATGKDITGWLRGGMKGSPESMGWWDRACAAASAAVSMAAGALNLIGKLKDILAKINAIVDKVKEAAAGAGRQVLCKLTGGCFLAGTLVAMGDGSFVPIEAVEVGAVVQCEVPAAMPGGHGVEMVQAVTDAGGRVYEGAIITVVVERGGKTAKVSGTPEHPFWCVNRHQWVPIAELAVGDRLDGTGGNVVVVGREVDFAKVEVFNFAVEQAHSYRVSELGVLVHNNGGENCWTAAGRRAHDGFREAMGDIADPSNCRLANGMVPDGVDWKNKVVYELKPDSPSGIRRGNQQLASYVEQLEAQGAGTFTPVLVTYGN